MTITIAARIYLLKNLNEKNLSTREDAEQDKNYDVGLEYNFCLLILFLISCLVGLLENETKSVLYLIVL